MAQVLVTGTAWEKSLEDYAYAAGLNRHGWAWEFLRRNTDYQRDFRINRAGTPVPVKHKSGAVYFRLRRRVLAAERWGLIMFANPSVSSLATGIHWHPSVTSRHVCCIAKAANSNSDGAECLGGFNARKHVLVTHDTEYLCVQRGNLYANLVISGASMLLQNCALNYQIEGLDRLNPVAETLTNLRRLKTESQLLQPASGQTEQRLRECLVALDGHLAGRTYRDIAEVLYGSDRVKEVWSNETRHLKDKVRRAVAAGVEYMNGGYLKLLQ